MKNISTLSVISLLKNNPNKWLEFSANIGNLLCTHFLSFSQNKIMSIGIDSEESIFSKKDFSVFYKNTFWKA